MLEDSFLAITCMEYFSYVTGSDVSPGPNKRNFSIKTKETTRP